MSHRDERYNVANIVNNPVTTLHGDFAYLGERWVLHRIVEWICCTPETSITLYVNYTSVKKRVEYLIIIKVFWLPGQIFFFLQNSYKLK